MASVSHSPAQGVARLAPARSGQSRSGMIRPGKVRSGAARQGEVGRGLVWYAPVWSGRAWHGIYEQEKQSVSIATLPKLALSEEQITNGAKDAIESGLPYRLECTVMGVAPLLFHAWNIEAVAEKAKAAKGSAAKKSDNIESYVYRDSNGYLGVPGQNFVSCLAISGKSMSDPRSPRKSMFDLCKAAIVPLDYVARFEPDKKEWDFEHAARVTVQRAAVTRVRPAMREGWRITFNLLINTPEYLPPEKMALLIGQAGRLVGLCDFRPSYGRFAVVHLEAHAE